MVTTSVRFIVSLDEEFEKARVKPFTRTRRRLSKYDFVGMSGEERT